MPLQPPSRDPNGNIQPHDHAEIGAEDILIRRISDQHLTGPAGNRRISSMAFQGSSDGTGMSVDIEKSIRDAGLDPVQFVTTPIFFCSVQFKAGDLRAEALQVGYYPLPTNSHHGAVWGAFGQGQRKRLRNIAKWFVEGAGVKLGEAA